MKFLKKRTLTIQKQIFLPVLLMIFSLNLFANGLKKNVESELSLFNEANSAFYTGFYPGAVDKADRLIESYPESVFIIPVSLIKGESLVYLGRYSQAEKVFMQIIPAIHLGDENYERAFFFLGKSLFYEKKYEGAIKAFHECCKTSLSQNHLKYYTESMIFAARSLFVIQKYDYAISVIENLIGKKENLTKSDYDELLQKLMICYNNTENYQKNIELYNSFTRDGFSDEIFYRLMLQAAFAHEEIGESQKSYELYCKIIQSGIKDLAVISLKRAYLITTKNPSVDSSELFEITRNSFGSTSLVSEFWARLGIDSYIEGDYVSAEKYFSSAKENNPAEFTCAIILYEQKIRLQNLQNNNDAESDGKLVENPVSEKEMLSDIEEKLISIEESIMESEFENIREVYFSALMQCYSLEGKWEKIPSLYEKCNVKNQINLYYYALALYNLNQFDRADEVLKNQQDVKFLNLAAKNSVAKNDLKNAGKTYEKLLKKLNSGAEKSKVASGKTAWENQEKKSLGENESLKKLPYGTSIDSIQSEYCKVLYRLGEYEKCLEESRKIHDWNGKYLEGLCAVMLRRWNDSILAFEDYIGNMEKSKGKSVIKNGKKDGRPEISDENQFYYIAVYYLGYSYYITGQFENAYKNFVKYNEDYQTVQSQKKHVAQAYEFAAKSALQLRKYELAWNQGEKLIESLSDSEKKQSAVMFTAEIYVDGGNYSSAIALLRPWTENKNDFAARCLLKTAQIYQKSGNLNQAEKVYEGIVSDYGKTVYAEESLYSCGEMFYSTGNYEKAEDKFGRYIYKYVEGKYAENALFFSADCNFKLKKYERSVMLNNRLCQKYKNSAYLYGAYKNLLDANYILKNYSDALTDARILADNFGAQAKNDGIEKRIVELEKIISGMDVSAAKIFSNFEEAGGIKTVKGRHAGTELVQHYVMDESTKADGIILALQLLPLEQGNLKEEVSDAAKNAFLIADWYRSKGSTKDAAQYYLLAAEYFRNSGELDESKPASALYGATESFVAEGMMGDARETSSLLKTLYPDSKYASVVDKLIY